MTVKELQKRTEKAQMLRVLQADGSFFVESSEGMILYKVSHEGEGKYVCSCGDYSRGIKQDANFRCKHILAVLNSISAGDTEYAEFLEKSKPKLDDRFIREIENREFVVYAGLLDLAHQKRLNKIEVEILQYPTKDNGHTAVCKASAYTAYGEVFSDVGDANPLNCNVKIARHLIRMASTRAKARALRDLTNIGMTCLEELGDLDEVIGDDIGDNGKTRRGIRKIKSEVAVPSKESVINKESKAHQDQAVEDAKVDKLNRSERPEVQTEARPEKEEKTEKLERPERTDKPDKPDSIPKMSSAQKNAIYNLSRRRGISVEELEKMVMDSYGVPLENLSSTSASAFIRQLQQSA